MKRKLVTLLVTISMLAESFMPAMPTYAIAPDEEAVKEITEPLEGASTADEEKEPEEAAEDNEEASDESASTDSAEDDSAEADTEELEISAEDIIEEESDGEMALVGYNATEMPVVLYVDESADNSTGSELVDLAHLSGKGWSYDPDENILTLNGFDGSYIECSNSLSIHLVGNNKITIDGTADVSEVSGIKLPRFYETNPGTLTINADNGGKLTISGTTEKSNNFYMITADKTVVDSGQIIISGQRTSNGGSFYGFNCKSTFNGESSFDIDLQSGGSVDGFAYDMTYNSSSASEVTVSTSSQYSDAIAVSQLYAYGSGALAITAQKQDTAPGKCTNNGLKVGNDAGRITFDGKVCTSISNITYTSLAGNKAVKNHLEGGYSFAGQKDPSYFFLTDLEGNLITDAVIDTEENQTLTVMAPESGFSISGLKVGEQFSTFGGEVFLYPRTRGGAEDYRYAVDENKPLPEGLIVNRYTGDIDGTPVSACASGTANIIVTDSENNTVTVEISYGPVVEKDRYLYVDGTQINILENGNDPNAGWNYSASDKTVTLNGYDGGPIYSEDLDQLTVKLNGNSKITIPSSGDPVSDGIGLSKQNASLTIKAETYETLTVSCEVAVSRNFNMIKADNITVESGHIILRGNKTSDSSGLCGFDGKTTFSGTSSFDIDLYSAGGTMYGFTYLTYNSSEDSTVIVETGSQSTYAVSASALYAYGTGKLTVSSKKSDGTPDYCTLNYLKVGTEAGKITFSGKVAYRKGELEAAKLAGNKAVTNYLSGGYNFAGSGDASRNFLTNSYGELITNAVIDTVENQPLTVMAPETGFFISGLTVGDTFSTFGGEVFLYPRTRGGSGSYTYTVDKDNPLPEGLKVDASRGFIDGTPSSVCASGTANIIVKDSEAHTVVVPVSYSEVSVKKPVEGVAFETGKVVFSAGEEQTVSASVAPLDASIPDVAFSSNNTAVVKVKNGSVVTTGNVTQATLIGEAAGKTTLLAVTKQGNKTASCDIWVKEATPEASYEITDSYIVLKYLITDEKYNIVIKDSDMVPMTKTAGSNGLIELDLSCLGQTVEITKVNEDTDLYSDAQELTLAAEMPTEIPLVIAQPCTGYPLDSLDNVKKNSPVSAYYSISSVGYYPVREICVAGEVYTVTVTVTAAGGMSFATGTTVKLNSNAMPSSEVSISDDGKTLRFVHTFPATESVLHAESITLDKEEYVLTIGFSETFSAEVLPANAINLLYEADTADHSIATVFGEQIRSAGIGKTTLTVTTLDGGKTDTADVYVKYSTPSITCEAEKLTGFEPSGTYAVTPDGGSAVTVTADEEGVITILDDWYTKYLNIIRKHAVYTKCDSDSTRILVGSKPPVSSDGMYVRFKNDETHYEYTGSAINPVMEVYNNAKLLTEGKDYLVKYSGNVKVKRDKAGNVIPGGVVTVTGKGDLSGSKTVEFTIDPKSLGTGTATPATGICTGAINIAKGQKATAPVITYGSYKLRASDYSINDPMAGKAYTEVGTTTMTVEGKGNFTGSVKLTVHVVEDKKNLKKFKVVVDTKTALFYDPASDADQARTKINGVIKVYDSADKSKETLTAGSDYVITYPSNLTGAGKKAVTVIGIGSYSGSVGKSVTIAPLVVKDSNNNGTITTNAATIKELTHKYVKGGVTIGDELEVKYVDPESHEYVLVEGRDYKISYSNNKVASKAGKPAEYSVSFIGNYKGTAALKNRKTDKKYTFEIETAPIANDYGYESEGFEAYAPDVAYTGKAGTYYSTPVVTYNGATFPASNYTVKY